MGSSQAAGVSADSCPSSCSGVNLSRSHQPPFGKASPLRRYGLDPFRLPARNSFMFQNNRWMSSRQLFALGFQVGQLLVQASDFLLLVTRVEGTDDSVGLAVEGLARDAAPGCVT